MSAPPNPSRKRPAPTVVTYDPPEWQSDKRQRAELGKEKAAFLHGSTALVREAAAGRLEQPVEPPRAAADPLDDRKRVRIDFNGLMKDVTALGAGAFTGKAKKVWEAKQMEALGGVVHFKEKMPLKMALGVMKARKRREAAAEAEARAAGMPMKGAKEANKARGYVPYEGPAGQPSSLDPDNLRGPVMYVKGMGKAKGSGGGRQDRAGGDGGASFGRGGGGFGAPPHRPAGDGR